MARVWYIQYHVTHAGRNRVKAAIYLVISLYKGQSLGSSLRHYCKPNQILIRQKDNLMPGPCSAFQSVNNFGNRFYQQEERTGCVLHFRIKSVNKVVKVVIL